MKKYIIYLCWIISSVVLAQKAGITYIEIDRSINQKLQLALEKEQTGDFIRAWEIYQKLANSSQAIPMLYSAFSTEQVQQTLSGNLEYKGICRGHYISVGSYIQQHVARTSYKIQDFPALGRQSQGSFELAMANSNPLEIYNLTRYPSFIYPPQIWLYIGDMLFQRGHVQLALGVWYKMRAWELPLNQDHELALDMRLAMGSALIGDTLVVDYLQKKYASTEKTICWNGANISLSTIFQNLQKNKKSNPSTIAYNFRDGYRKTTCSLENASWKTIFHKHGDGRKYSFPLWVGDTLYYQAYSLIHRTMAVEAISAKKPDKILWKKALPSSAYAFAMTEDYAPLITYHDKKIYVSFHESHRSISYMYCMHAKTGELLWKWPAKEESIFPPDTFMFPQCAPIAIGSNIIFPITLIGVQTSHEMICLSAASGALQWRRFISSHTLSESNTVSRKKLQNKIVSAYGLVYTCSDRGIISAIDVSSGDIVWWSNYHELLPQKYHLQTGAKDNDHPAQMIVRHGKLYVIPGDVGILFIYSATTGKFERAYPDGHCSGGVSTLYGIDDLGRVWLFEADNIVVLQEDGLEEIWKKIPLGYYSFGFMSSNFLYVQGNETFLQVDLTTGASKIFAIQDEAQKKCPFLILEKNGHNYFIRAGNSILFQQHATKK